MTPNTRKSVADAKTNTAAIAAAIEGLNVPVSVQEIHGVPVMIAPSDVELEDLSEYLPSPRRIKAQPKFEDAKGLAVYVNAFGDKTNTMVFASSVGVITAVLDYHAPAAPAWGDHRATCTLVETPEWLAWRQKDGKSMDQETFSQFLEDRIGEIAEPNGAELVEIARTLEVKKNLVFKSHQRATDGAMSVVYDEDVSGTAKGGQLKIPTEFTLLMAPIRGGVAVEVKARLRFRIASGTLALTFHLIDREKIQREAIEAVVAEFEQRTADRVRAVVMGAPA